MKIIIAEDNPEVLDSLVGMMRNQGHEVRETLDGEQALLQFREWDPDGIFSALTLPKLGGLELLQEVRSQNQKLPFVLICSVNNPEKIHDALKKGAVDFLIRPIQEKDLLRTLKRVSTLTQGFRFSAYAMDHLVEESRVLEIDNDIDGVNRIVAFLTQDLPSYGILEQEELFRINSLLAEALENAIFHGNLELPGELRVENPKLFLETALQKCRIKPYQNRRIMIQYNVSRNSVKYLIRDEGKGFDHAGLPDPSDPQNLFQVRGRGLLLISLFMDEVFWNERGNEITMIHYKKRKTLS